MNMADQDVILDQDGFPASRERRSRQGPPRSRSRSTPRRSKSGDADDATVHKSPTKMAASSLQTVQSGLQKANLNETTLDVDFSEFNGDVDSASAKRRSPRRCKSSDGHDKDLIDRAKAQMAMNAALNPTNSTGDKVKVKVIVRKKKGSKDPNTSPSSTVKSRRAIKVPTGALDFAAFDTKGENKVLSPSQGITKGFNPNNIEKSLVTQSKMLESKPTTPSRGREVLHREGRARSLSRRSTRSRSRGRMQSSKINLDEDDSDTELADDEPDDDLGVGIDSVVDDILQNRREQGVGVLEKHNSSKSVNGFLGRKKEPVTAPLLSSLANGKVDTVVSTKDSMRISGGRNRFTNAGEWSSVVDDLIQKRRDGKEAGKDDDGDDDDKSKPKGLGRLFVPNRK